MPMQIATANDPSWTRSNCGDYYTFAHSLEKSKNDDRDYRLIRLGNDLEVILVHDEKADIASAALDVHVGHMSDPSHLQGLAHFCEHMLFLGTEKYPEENEYNKYLSNHSGHSNAFTGTEHTNYHFEVGYEHLEGALDRFAQFFIQPLFTKSCTERELKAVDSEHQKNRQVDAWRMFQLGKSLSNPNHPFCQFGTGNLETLRDDPTKGIDVRAELLKFHSEYYSSNIMKLCILGRESLDELTSWAVEKFSQVKNKHIDPPSLNFRGSPLTEKELKKQIFVKPVMDSNKTLEMEFPIPDQHPLYAVKPANYIAHMVGHEAAGSILSLLKRKSWATALQAGPAHLGIGVEFCHFSIDLTDEGLEHYQDVVRIVFQYIDLLKGGVQKSVFEETQSLASLSFDFKEKRPSSLYTTQLADLMQRCYPPHLILSGSSLIPEYNPDMIMEHINCIRPDNLRLFIMCRDPPHHVKFTEKERWYDTEYAVMDFEDSFSKMLDDVKPNKELHLPKPNEFMPKNFDVDKQDVKEPTKKPNLILSTPQLRLWHKKDDTFWVPKATVRILLRSPRTNGTLTDNVKTNLFLALLKDNLDEYAYYAEIAQLYYDVKNTQDGIQVLVEGYNDKLPVLLDHMFRKIRNFELDRTRFKMIKDEQCKWMKNFSMISPYEHAMMNIGNVMEEKYWTHTEKLKELELLDAADIEVFHPILLSQLHIEALFHGNLTEDAAVKMMTTVLDIMKAEEFKENSTSSSKIVALPKGSKWIRNVDVENPEDENSAIYYLIQIGNITQKRLRCEVELFAQLASEPFFDQLRTKEQLGYIVAIRAAKKNGVVDLFGIVQSERDPIYLESRIDAFLNKLTEDIKTMKKEDFEKQVNALISKKKEKCHRLAEETQKYWSKIGLRHYEFDQAEHDVKELEAITQDSLVKFAEEYVLPGSASVRKMSIHMRSQKLHLKELHRRLKEDGVTCLSYKELEKAHKENKEEGSFVEALLTKIRSAIKAEKAKMQEDMNHLVQVDKKQVEQVENATCEELPDETFETEEPNGNLERDVDEAFGTAKQSLEKALAQGREPYMSLPDNTLVENPVAFKANMPMERAFPPWQDSWLDKMKSLVGPWLSS